MTSPASNSTDRSVALAVTGMHCPSCVGRVQGALQKVAGVRSARVDLTAGTATVRFDPDAVTPEALVASVRAVGYGASLQ